MLPAARRADEELVRGRIHVDAVGWHHDAEAVPHLQTLYRAVWENRRLVLVYRTPFGIEVERLAEPYGLVAKAGVWYLVCVRGGRLRVHPLAELLESRETGDLFERPAGFDLATYWQAACAEMDASRPSFLVTLRVAPALIPRLPHHFGEQARDLLIQGGPHDGSKWLTAQLTFESFEAARSASWGSAAPSRCWSRRPCAAASPTLPLRPSPCTRCRGAWHAPHPCPGFASSVRWGKIGLHLAIPATRRSACRSGKEAAQMVRRLVLGLLLAGLIMGCLSPPTPAPAPGVTVTPADPYLSQRTAMVNEQIQARGVRNEAVLAAMRRVPRHRFVPAEYVAEAYADHPLPIGYGQTISQPYVVALMTEALALQPGARVLEIGTGSGYQAAILAELGMQVYTVEIIPELASQARKRLPELGYGDVRVRQGDGYYGWQENAPYDAIVVTAAPDHLPQPLAAQLAEGGRLVVPIGPVGSFQTLWRFDKQGGELTATNLGDVRFVPLTGAGH